MPRTCSVRVDRTMAVASRSSLAALAPGNCIANDWSTAGYGAVVTVSLASGMCDAPVLPRTSASETGKLSVRVSNRVEAGRNTTALLIGRLFRNVTGAVAREVKNGWARPGAFGGRPEAKVRREAVVEPAKQAPPRRVAGGANRTRSRSINRLSNRVEAASGEGPCLVEDGSSEWNVSPRTARVLRSES